MTERPSPTLRRAERALRVPKSLALALWLAVLGLAGCAHTGARPEVPPGPVSPAPPPRPPAPPPPVVVEPPKPHHAWFAEGLASFYGPGLWGHRTASGKRLRKKDLTAAHRSLPFGTCLSVLDLDNGRSVRVRVNDRGPFAPHRLIDVSYAAGRALGMLETGLAHVRLFFCGKEPVDARAGQR